MNFADRIADRIKLTDSLLVAGIDPIVDDFPAFIKEAASKRQSSAERHYFGLMEFFELVIPVIAAGVPAIKPNIAFFEQYGIGGLRAFKEICRRARQVGIPLIADIKRGDIGHTAAAYSRAYLASNSGGTADDELFDVDAVTLNPYLGFETLSAYIDDAKKYDKGIFVLVRTSNPGARDLQDLRDGKSGLTVYETVANWLAQAAEQLIGSCGYSSLGAVVGALYPEDARRLRAIMPKNLFLVPGFGSQGGSAQDACAGVGHIGGRAGGALINASRALLGGLQNVATPAELVAELQKRVVSLTNELRSGLRACVTGS